MANITSAIRDTISISLFNRGLAGKIFEDVKQSGAKVVMKNNSAECVLMSPDEYVKLMDEVNDARLLSIANERMQNFNPANLISSEDLYKELGITDIDNIVYSGTNVVTGRAKAIVVGIGLNTEIGKIANSINEAKEEKYVEVNKLWHLAFDFANENYPDWKDVTAYWDITNDKEKNKVK